VHPEFRRPPVDQYGTAPVETVPVHGAVTPAEPAGIRTRRTHLTPILNVLLTIDAERTKLSAWFRVGFWLRFLSRFMTPSTNTSPKPF
jgi:hypothetical protein